MRIADEELLLNLQVLNSLDLQWFAEPEDEGRTEDPTEHKLRKAREEGKVAKSQDLVSSIHLLVCTIGLLILGKFLLNGLMETFDYFSKAVALADSIPPMVHIRYSILQIFKLILPILGIAVIAGAMGNMVQVGFLFSTKPIEFDLKKIVPKFGRFFKEGFFSKEAVFKLVKSLIEVAVIVLLGYLNFLLKKDQFLTLFEMDLIDSIFFMFNFLMTLFIEAALLFLGISIVDYVVQRRKFRKEMQMSKYEVKQEYKELEGDPQVKQYIQQRMNQILSQNFSKALDEATVVITNPTHYAVILEYKLHQEAPKVVGKGQDIDALLIRRLAKEKEVAIVENKPLARALYKEVNVGQLIPYQFYNAIAAILKVVMGFDHSTEEVV